MSKLNIAIANDMALAREALRRVVESRPDHQLIWIAQDGEDALRHCKAQKPDILLMDLRMPQMDGSEATSRIMAEAPCAIIVVTANVQDNLDLVFEAMSNGALDAVSTPKLGRDGLLEGGEELLAKIHTVSSLIRKQQPVSASTPAPTTENQKCPCDCLLAIGASTGGPQAIATILSKLPADFAPAVAIVQHVDAQFAPGLAEWLDGRCALDVRPAPDGTRLTNGTVWLAATNNHMILEPDRTLCYHSHPRESHYRPSVDVFFQSVAHHQFDRGCAVLLTGMGKDGATGMKLLHDQGFYTLAQNEASSVVYGMPHAAEKLGAVDRVLPPEEIANAILNYFAPQPANA